MHTTSEHNDLFDICIVGAGMAGATIATYLAPRGIKIALIDRDYAEKRRIVGELLQPGAVQTLKKMGLEHLLEGFDAQPIYGYALFNKDSEFSIEYNQDKSTNYRGVGLHNGRFLQKIREDALKQPSITQIHGTVSELIEDENHVVTGVKYKEKHTRELKTVNAKLTITSDGFFSSFRKDLTNNVKTVTSFFVGIILKGCELPYPHHGHVFLSAPTPFICYPISSTESRLLIDFPGDQAPKKETVKHHIENNVIPFLPKEFRHCLDQALRENDYKIMPNHYMPAKPVLKEGVVLLGDALNMRHPITGGGLTAVFNDVYLLSTHLLAMPDFNDTKLIHEKVNLYYNDRYHANTNVNIMANALYGVMSNDLLKQSVFEYLRKGGDNSGGPISLLAGLNRNPTILIKHFFSVALLCLRNLFKAHKMSLTNAFYVIKDAFCIIAPLAINELRPSSFLKKNIHN
ncbi:FAD-dependent oxidoreductase [methanotrophic endosymbiont of Bathymodiolus puteoserpentis (Logatchev)]|jgi:squalene monooxygenase|uniref:FAD-dependent oxidoreductase n=1 Tax=methanotrophic endosymbiont of Bathymodiolus puteoserpentis (Logatchev) TaxID=343235 RepID=UPI00157A90D9|nr:FAD-dependent oxidoreductase [methanotrophic endosymbiont of Bathymodiolus puteoserpentis (Logatchev)]